jgi:hypothetical protein
MNETPNWFERTFEHKGGLAPEVKRMSASGAHIVCITHELIEYVNTAGKRQFIDLEECARNWMRYRHDHSHEFISLPPVPEIKFEDYGAAALLFNFKDSRCVALRDTYAGWVEFMNDRKTRFEFPAGQGFGGDIWRELLMPLLQVGWCTFDTT